MNNIFAGYYFVSKIWYNIFIYIKHIGIRPILYRYNTVKMVYFRAKHDIYLWAIMWIVVTSV